MKKMLVSWFSAGVSSAVAAKMCEPDKIIYIDIDDQHEDTYRFLRDCEKWFGKEIEILKSPLGSVKNACLSASYIRGPAGAACTSRLKRRVRQEWEQDNGHYHTYVWGFDANERHRAARIVETMPKNKHLFPLIDLTKRHVHGLLRKAKIKRPLMYDLGYPNNNCVGCLKGGMGYWNKIRLDFPDVFRDRCNMERRIGAHILPDCFLEELDSNRGRNLKPIVPDCGLFCEIEGMEL